MFFDKDQKNKKQIQKAYYQGLKQEIQMKNSKLAQRKYFNDNPLQGQKQQFSLIKNIETQEEIRKNKKSQYYVELRKQLEDEKNKKERMKQEQKRLQKIQQEKINRENQILRQRYEQQIKKQKKSSNNNKQQNPFGSIPENTKRKNTHNLSPLHKNDQNRRHLTKNNQGFNRLKTTDSQQEDQEDEHQNKNSLQLQSMNYKEKSRENSLNQLSYQMPTYINRIENEPFNYIPKKRHMDSYFKQLLVQRRQFQHQASGISQLNKLFHQDRYRPQKIQSKGLEELKNLQILLEQKSSQYMSNLNSRPSKSYSLSQNSLFKPKQSIFYQPKDEWRRLD